MTSDEFWVAVGENFLLARQRRRLKPSHIQALGGPHYDTVGDIERGHIGNVDRLESYAKALSIELVDVFSTVLKTDAQALTPEQRQLVRKYETTTVEGRMALVAMAAALPIGTPAAPTESPVAAPENSRDTPPASVVPRRSESHDPSRVSGGSPPPTKKRKA